MNHLYNQLKLIRVTYFPCSVEVKHRSSSSSSSSGCLSPSSCSVVDSISTDSDTDAENDDDAGYYGAHNGGAGEGSPAPGPIAAEGISPDMMGLRSKESEEEAERPPSSSGVSSRKTSAESVTSSG